MICAIIVTYNPDLRSVSALLERLKSQADVIVVIDNGSGSIAVGELGSLTASYGSILIRNHLNVGIAEALNQGIVFARQAGASFVLLLDQDSLPANNMVTRLRAAFAFKERQGFNVAAVGPSYTDIKGRSLSPFVKLKGSRLHRVSYKAHEIVSVDQLITSGSLVCLNALTVIGDMESLLFIDYVDTEWCLRAKFRGYELYGVADAKMDHDLGEGMSRFMGRNLPVHSPLRYYYLVRNGIWILRQPWVGTQWKLMDVRRLFIIYIVYSIFLGQGFSNWRMMTRGLWHGLIGKMGKFF